MQQRATTPAGALLDLAIEDLESLTAPDESADFFTGIAIGLAMVALFT